MESYIIPTRKEFLPDITKRRLVSMRNKEPEERYRRHFDAAIMRKDGNTIGEIAEELDIHPGTVMNWLNRMVEVGGLGEGYKTRQGRPPKFTSEQLDDLVMDMEESPRHYGLDSETWTSRVVAQYVLTKFEVEITPGSMRRIMTRNDLNWPGSAAATLARKRGEPYP